MKRCPENHDNPDNAKFCRICGYNFGNSFSKKRSISEFTPDKFPGINLIPCSVANVDFHCKKGLIFMVILVVLFVALRNQQFVIEKLMRFKWDWPTDLVYYVIPAIMSLLGILFIAKFIPLIHRLWKWLRYKMNVEYIEKSSFVQTLYRIAKKGKLGLFDKSKNTVMIRSRYDNITIFDHEHILIEKNGKKGLFSLKKMSLIVPVRFDCIDAFKNSIVKCYNGAESYYYDVNGNRMN